jgi:YidC/Oxa1 family membrane protein insertase
MIRFPEKMKMDTTRLILTTILLLLVFQLYQEWQKDYGPAAPTEVTAGNGKAQTTMAGSSVATDSPDIPVMESENPVRQTEIPGQQTGEDFGRVTVETDVFSLQIGLQGAGILYAGLKKYPATIDAPDNPLVLMDNSSSLTYYTQDGLLSAQPAPTHEKSFHSPRNEYVLGDDQDILEVPLVWEAEDGSVKVTKLYRFQRGSHLVNVRYEIENHSQGDWNGRYYSQLKRNDPGRASKLGIYTYTGAVLSNPENRYEKISFGDMQEGKTEQKTSNGWVAMIQHYFVTALIPGNKTDEYNFYANSLKDGNFAAGMISPGLTVQAGASGYMESNLYIGPKLQERLSEIAEGLDLTVDYGKLWFLSKPLFLGLSLLHDITGNWGWAIILVTVVLKLLFFPLSAAGYRSMANMRKVQPRMMALRDRYKNDKAQLNKAMMQLYKEEKINPFGGCLPILVQIPVFIALYWVLLESVEMRQTPFIFWLHDLSTKDPFYILPLLMGGTMFIQQKLNPAPMDPVQAKVMSILPVVFTVFFAFFPSGLVLYWVVNNVLSIAQQWQITRNLERSGLAPPRK